MLVASEWVIKLYENNEFKVMIITGDHGYGKSTYANRIISEAYSEDGIHGNWKIELFKKHLGFHPVNVTDHWLGMKKRDKAFHWDDSGLWLNAMDYQDPFVVSVGKYLQVARTDWGCLLFTAIDRDDVFSKLRNVRSAIVVEIIKHSSKKEPYRRKAIAYNFWRSRSGSRKGTNNLWEEDFNCHVPDRFYEWYQPLRVKYAYLAKKQMREYLRKKHKDLFKSAKEMEV
jgi:hypothetical protein